MNAQILSHQRNKSIIRVMDNHAATLEGKTEILNAKLLFVSKNNRIEELIAQLVPPVSIIYAPKKETKAILRNKVKRMTGLGILIAQKHNDLKMLETMKAYKTLAYKTTAYKLYENASKVADAIEEFSEDAAGFGFTEEEIVLFRSVVTTYGETLTDTGNQLNDRKVSRSEIATLFKDCNKLLKEHFDPFALFVSEIHPEFFREYSLLRTTSGRKKTVKDAVEEQGEISGTIYDSVSGLPLAGVSVSIPGFELVTVTDEDGYYLFDELFSGKYRLTCSKQGYQVPPEKTAEITADNTSIDIDFSLVVAEAANAA
jgi:hypothetical protein